MDERQESRKQERRRRRVRNQIMAYAAVLLFITLAAVGMIWGAGKLAQSRKEAQTAQKESQSALENILSAEDELSMPSSEPEPEPEPEPAPEPEPTPEQKLDELIDSLLGVMSLEDKVAGLFIVTPESITGVATAVKAGDGTRQALEKHAVGGLVYGAKNIKSDAQLKKMLEDTKTYASYPLFLAVEEEGGKRSTVANAGIGTKADDAQTIGESGNAEAAYQAGATLGANLAGVGINLSFSPVADPATADKSWLGKRAYGASGQITGVMATSAMQGVESQGVTSCVKYFPGVGSAVKNPEKELASTDRTEEQFRQEEFPAFQAVVSAGAHMMMISSVAAPELTGNNEPCVFSEKVVTDILRGELGFGGVIISDALNQAAISDYYASEEAAIMALKAGCDMILCPEDFEKAYDGVLKAVQNGTISEERVNDAIRRIYRIKYAGKLEE